MKRSEEVIILNDLIRIHNDRTDGYKKISNAVREEYSHLKVLFIKYAMDSKIYANKLEHIVVSLGGNFAEDIEIGTIYKIWMDAQTAFLGHIKGINVCEFGEHAIQNAYLFAIESSSKISESTLDILEDQQFSLNEVYKNMRLNRIISESVL